LPLGTTGLCKYADFGIWIGPKKAVAPKKKAAALKKLAGVKKT
jgi:hypothetical protein